MTLRTAFSALFLLALMLPTEAAAQLHLSRLFSDGAVLQRDAEVPVWGWAAPDETVAVTFDGTTYTATAAADSSWRVVLPPMEAGGPYALAVEAGGERREVENLLVGDVWIASGQSNMEWTVADAQNAEAEMAAADGPRIRHFKVPQSWAEEPEETLAGGDWQSADSEHVGQFTAVGYFFARALRESEGVPIGILNTTWGGSRIEPWMDAEALGYSPAEAEAVWQEEEARAEAIRESVRDKIGELPESDPGMVNGEPVWAAPDLDDADWFELPVPSPWEAAGFPGLDGTAWYRTSFELTDEEAQEGITLGLGMIDDSDVTWVNGTRVGGMDNSWNVARVYEVPASALHAGENTIAVRVMDFQGGGGIAGPEETVYLETAQGRRDLPDTWRFMVGEVTLGGSGGKNQVPMALWNKMVYPLLPFPAKGIIWYQGESNANTMEDAVAYRELFPTMIESWRAAWGQPDMPFLWVQLANYMAADDEPADESNWATLREAQSATLALPHTGQAVIIDLGEADDIHPRNKQDVGARLALAARKVAYGEDDLVYSGPTYAGHEVEDGRVLVRFDHVGGGLEARGGDLGGFAIAGPDRQWVWADARIEGDQVIVWSDEVAEPVAVRYAWGNNPADANLYNAEGLPADPFRTDTW